MQGKNALSLWHLPLCPSCLRSFSEACGMRFHLVRKDSSVYVWFMAMWAGAMSISSITSEVILASSAALQSQ